MDGSARPFEGAEIESSRVRGEMLEPCDLDASTIEVLQVRDEKHRYGLLIEQPLLCGSAGECPHSGHVICYLHHAEGYCYKREALISHFHMKLTLKEQRTTLHSSWQINFSLLFSLY